MQRVVNVARFLDQLCNLLIWSFGVVLGIWSLGVPAGQPQSWWAVAIVFLDAYKAPIIYTIFWICVLRALAWLARKWGERRIWSACALLQSVLASMHAASIGQIKPNAQGHCTLIVYRANDRGTRLEAISSSRAIPKGLESFKISAPDKGANEGIAGQCWHRNVGILASDERVPVGPDEDLPDIKKLAKSRREGAIRRYAELTFVSVAAIKRYATPATTQHGYPVLLSGKHVPWGVLLLLADSSMSPLEQSQYVAFLQSPGGPISTLESFVAAREHGQGKYCSAYAAG